MCLVLQSRSGFFPMNTGISGKSGIPETYTFECGASSHSLSLLVLGMYAYTSSD